MALEDKEKEEPHQLAIKFIKDIRIQAQERLSLLAKERDMLLAKLVNVDEAQRTIMVFLQMDTKELPLVSGHASG